MNREVITGNWTEFKGRLKEKWGEISEDEIEKTEGKVEQIEGLLRQKYGYSADEVHEHLNTWFDSVKDYLSESNSEKPKGEK